jgi:hypothetical protein
MTSPAEIDRLVGVKPTERKPQDAGFGLVHSQPLAPTSLIPFFAHEPTLKGYGGTIDCMWQWIWIVAVYLLSISLLRWLGGIGSAADAIQRWGHAVGERRRSQLPRRR